VQFEDARGEWAQAAERGTVSTVQSDPRAEGPVAIEVPPHGGLVLRDTALTRMLDRVVYAVGEVFHWIWIALLAVIIINVILRYVFSRGMIELEELQWYLYAVGWLIGLSYTFISDDHVRVDVLHEKLSYRGKLWFEMGGLLLLFLPFVLFVVIYAVPFVELSWETNERSTSANGLPARWLVKGFLLFSFVLLVLAGVSRLLKVLASIASGAPATPSQVTGR
jgi:TRAP-type mannitol/chloroaromatic compound transport system permease small subunit